MLQCCSNIAEWDIITQLGHAAAGRGGDGNGDEASIVRSASVRPLSGLCQGVGLNSEDLEASVRPLSGRGDEA